MKTTRQIKIAFFLIFLASLVGCGGGSGSNNAIYNNTGSNGNTGDNNTKTLIGGSIQGVSLPLLEIPQVSTINGSFYKDPSYVRDVTFFTSDGITSDGVYLYIANASGSISKVEIATGIVTNLAGSSSYSGAVDGIGTAARFNYPIGIVIANYDLYVTDSRNNTIRKIVISTGEVTTLAGRAGTSGAADGIGAVATFNSPRGITTDGVNLYVVDTDNHTIRKIEIATRTVTTLAGSAGITGSTNGIGPATMFNAPVDITTDGSNLYVIDWYNNNAIRKIVISTGEVSTLVVGSDPMYSSFYNGITTDGINLFVSDTTNNVVNKVDIATGSVSTLAGLAGSSGLVDGSATEARFQRPRAVTKVGLSLFVIDSNNNKIREINIPTGDVVTKEINSKSTDGSAAIATFNRPADITTDGTNLYVADAGNSSIRKIVISTGAVSTLAGKSGYAGSVNATGIQARFNYPTGITTDGTNLYVADEHNRTIRIVEISTGNTTTLAGTAGITGSADGTGPAARFDSPNHITTDGINLYVTDSGNNTIRKIVISTGIVTTLAGTAGITGSEDGTGTTASFNWPDGITTDGINLFVTDYKNNTVRKIVISNGVVTTLAGNKYFRGADDGIGTSATFNYPDSITTDGVNLYVSDTVNQTIRKIVISTGAVTTIAGYAGVSGNTDGLGSSARFHYPWGITTDGTSLYVVDNWNDNIRKIN